MEGTGKGGCRVNDKVCKKSNTNTSKMINEVLEQYEYENHNQDEISKNYVQIVDTEVVGNFNTKTNRLENETATARFYNQKIEDWLYNNSEYYKHTDKKGRKRKINDDKVMMREYVFYIPPDKSQMFYDDEELYKKWCDDNLNWFKKQFPHAHVVASVGHYTTEKTPHMQLLFIPLDEKGKLSNSKDFYDWIDGKKQFSGKIKQSERQQDYIKTVLHQYGIEGGIKGSKSTHKDLDEYKSKLKHEIKEIENDKKEQLIEYENLSLELDDTYNQYNDLVHVYNQKSDIMKELENQIDDYQNTIKKNEEILKQQLLTQQHNLDVDLKIKHLETENKNLKKENNKLNDLCSFMFEHLPTTLKNQVLNMLNIQNINQEKVD